MEIGISAIGIAVPKYRQAQNDIAKFIGDRLHLSGQEKRRLAAIYKNSGIDFRYSVIDDFSKECGEFEFFPNNNSPDFPLTKKRMDLYQKNALPLALEAIQSAQINDYKNITHLITVSCTGMYAPGLDIEIIEHLSFSTNIHRIAINFMGCYGSFNAMKTAFAICKADTNARVLIVSLELCSLHMQSSNSLDHLISGAIFADGAGAILVEGKKDTIKSLVIQNFYCDLLPESKNEMTWSISDYGFDIILSSYVAKLIKDGIAKFLDNALVFYNIKKDDIEYFAIHPGGKNILKACEEALKISKKDNQISYDILRKFGNMSSATIIFVLKALWEKLQKNNHQNTVFSCGFGPGLVLESMLLKVYC